MFKKSINELNKDKLRPPGEYGPHGKAKEYHNLK